MNTRFIELAGEINTHMPEYVIERVAFALNKHKKAVNGSRILILGMSYKKDIDDMRESPSLKLLELLLERGAEVEYNDPFFNELPKTRKYEFTKQSVELTDENLKSFDLVLLSTNHSQYDYKRICDQANLIVDTRNVFSEHCGPQNLYKA